MHIRLKFRSHLIDLKLTHENSRTRALVAPGERDRNLVGKSVNGEARKALVYAKVPVPQTDTGR